jgi:hypothetical protein
MLSNSVKVHNAHSTTFFFFFFRFHFRVPKGTEPHVTRPPVVDLPLMLPSAVNPSLKEQLPRLVRPVLCCAKR